MNIQGEAQRYADMRTHAGRAFDTAMARAMAKAKASDVIQYVLASPHGFVITTMRPQIGDSWRVGPAGTITSVRSGS